MNRRKDLRQGVEICHVWLQWLTRMLGKTEVCIVKFVYFVY